MPTFSELRPVYASLWSSMTINLSRSSDAARCVQTIMANVQTYKEVQRRSGVWWPIVACIHAMESSFSFQKHLHNGDSLNARTWRVPAGRPKTGKPPFTWDFSAADAIGMKDAILDALGGTLDTPEECLYYLENYNGWGYQNGAGRNTTPPKRSPYLWAGSNQWVRGKYVVDGRFDPYAGSSQFGAACILKALELAGHITFGAPKKELPKADAKPYEPAVVPAPGSVLAAGPLRFGQKNEDVRWLIAALMGLGFLRMDSVTTDVFNEAVQDAVIWLQTKHDLEVDGIVGPQTVREIRNLLTDARKPKAPPAPVKEGEFPPDDPKTIRITKGGANLSRPKWRGLVPIVVELAGKSWVCASGQPWAQDFDLPSDPGSVPGNMEPIPQGLYKIGDIQWSRGRDVIVPGAKDGIGGCFIPIVAAFEDDRGAFGFHIDSNIDTSPGSAGCVVFYTEAELREFIGFLRQYDPKRCIVDWGLIPKKAIA
jgi:lysozyme family protein